MESDSAKKILSFLIRMQNSPLNVATYKFFRSFMQRTDWKIFMFKYFIQKHRKTNTVICWKLAIDKWGLAVQFC